MRVAPDAAIGEEEKTGEDDQKRHHAKAEPLRGAFLCMMCVLVLGASSLTWELRPYPWVILMLPCISRANLYRGLVKRAWPDVGRYAGRELARGGPFR